MPRRIWIILTKAILSGYIRDNRVKSLRKQEVMRSETLMVELVGDRRWNLKRGGEKDEESCR